MLAACSPGCVQGSYDRGHPCMPREECEASRRRDHTGGLAGERQSAPGVCAGMLAEKCYIVSMRRTQIQLPEAEYNELRETAGRLRRSMADCIREAIRLFLGRSKSAGIDLESIAGKFRPLRTTGLKPHDRRLAEAILTSKGRGKRK